MKRLVLGAICAITVSTTLSNEASACWLFRRCAPVWCGPPVCVDYCPPVIWDCPRPVPYPPMAPANDTPKDPRDPGYEPAFGAGTPKTSVNVNPGRSWIYGSDRRGTGRGRTDGVAGALHARPRAS